MMDGSEREFVPYSFPFLGFPGFRFYQRLPFVKWYWYFFGTENRNGIELYHYKIPINVSLSLDMKPGTSNSDKWYRKFRSFR